jgi:tetratricopeptide (TPR) repeat protein
MTPDDAPGPSEDLFDALAARARATQSGREWARARAEWAEIGGRFPHRWEGAVGEAACLIELGEYDKAEEMLSAAMSRFPDIWEPGRELGRLAFYRRDWPRGIARWRALRERFPDLAEAAGGYAAILRDSGNFAEAEIAHAEGMLRFPDYFWLAYSHALVAQHQQHWEEALARWSFVRDRFATEAGGYSGEAEALRKLGRHEEALATLRTAATLFPGNTEIERKIAVLEEEVPHLRSLRQDPRAAANPWAEKAAFDPDTVVVGVLISHDPVIIHSATYSFADVVVPTMAWYRKTGRRVHYLFNSNMSIEFQPQLGEKLLRELGGLREHYPDASITFLVNDIGELMLARKLGFPAELISNNAFVDERVFVIAPQAVKRFDAVLNARFHPYKRHELAINVESLVLLAAEPTAEQLAELSALLPRAHLIGTHVDAAGVVAVVNSARCGLALSGAEGANYATIEYLLCGVPVVTTRCIGGRNWWLSDDVAVYAEDTPQDVADAVVRMVKRSPSPEAVREHALLRLRRERLAFFALVDRIFAENGQPGRRYEAEFMRDFHDKWNYAWRPARAFRAPA